MNPDPAVATTRSAYGYVGGDPLNASPGLVGEAQVVDGRAEGGTGPYPCTGSGVEYLGGTGGPGLNSRLTGVRITEPTSARFPRRVDR